MKKPLRWQSHLTRRDFLTLSAGSLTTIMFSGCSSLSTGFSQPNNEENFVRLFGPIDRTIDKNLAEAKFYGDQNERPHRILWNLPEYRKNKKIESVENAPVVIVGGGVSGLFSAYSLRKYKPILLEQASRFGGNAKGQSWRGLDYSIGAAYIDQPHPGSPMFDYFKELNLSEILVQRSGSDPIEVNGKLYKDFWNGQSEIKYQGQYKKMAQAFAAINAEIDRPFPFIPSLNAGHRASVKYYDQYDLHGYLSHVVGGKLGPNLETAIEHYCWSTYAASSKEISAAAAFNFLAQEANPIFIGSGGNSKIAERVLSRLYQSLPGANLRPSSIVVEVNVKGDSAQVVYEDGQGVLRAINAKAVIMSCPKFIAVKVIPDLETKRLNAIKKLRYRSYMTANLLLGTSLKEKFFDLFMVGKNKINFNNIRDTQDQQNATDFISANFAGHTNSDTALTFYRAFPFDGARAELYQPNSYEIYKKKFEEQISRDILPLIGASQKDVIDLRLALWGHALPLAAKGLYSDNTVDQLRKPFRERVFFIEQDNWAYPSLQTGATESVLLKSQIEKVLS